MKKAVNKFKVVGLMSWVPVKLGRYKDIKEAEKAVKTFEEKKLYTDLRVEKEFNMV
jgi:hypothetical protein